jgi:hypothetical protein
MNDIKLFLEIMVDVLHIAYDWDINDVQVHPPPEWNLEAWTEDKQDGWVHVMDLARKAEELREGLDDGG